ncbi:hypothetical protein DCMF_10980 [Candidatus Formimonas warabiya]|uniref:DUF1638 domain-containing protein n=2 Tax=Formimonas warabiya TaxID=1761012 RepID=A0A3G1KRY9_FORW1|nr:hypothetical protein DCMF_10980 [Candidatus Formimonas warabiya]
MSIVIVACQTICDEVDLAIAETGVSHPVLWVESGLHNFPDTLRTKLQEQINRISHVEKIILAYGYCGNSLLGLYSDHATLVIPRVDDCISLLLGSYQSRERLSQEMGTYFLTRGWLENENNIIKEYERCLDRYGQVQAERVMKVMMEHYRRLVLIDTGAYAVDGCLKKSCDFSQRMGLQHQVVTGSLRLLKKLFTGPWDEEFLVLKPGEVLSMEYFRRDMSKPGFNQTMFGFGR